VTEPVDVFVALQRDAGEVEVVGVFRSLDSAIAALGESLVGWREITPGRWSDGQGLRVERHVLL
jgi:hypothetical protein